MTPASYLEWSELSGIYLRNVSHLDRYATFRPLISPAGLTTIVVGEFLNANPGEVNVADWRTHSVYEPGNEGRERSELTATALETIGAARAAAAVRTARSNSPFEMLRNMDHKNPEAMLAAMSNIGLPAMLSQLREDVARMMPDVAAEAGLKATPQQTPTTAEGQAQYETRQQIETLLAQFVTDHQAELAADLARHGDPRTAPGFTRESRLAELERLRRQQCAREAQREDAAKLNQLIDKLRKKVQAAGDDPEGLLAKQAERRRLRDFHDLVTRHRNHAADDLLSEMSDALQAAADFKQSCPQLFAQAISGDPQLDARLQALGDFVCDRWENEWQIEWENPTGFSGQRGKFALSFTLPAKQKQAVRKLLDAVERLRPRLSEFADAWKRELIEQFRNYEAQMGDWQLDDYELSDGGQVTEASILEHAGKGSICLVFGDGSVLGRTQYNVDWDEEHGCEIEWNGALLNTLSREDTASAEHGDERPLDFGSVTFHDSGPALSRADLDAFEARCQIRLPSEYRQFLLAHNGGCPEPGHLSVKCEGANRPADVVCFFALWGGPEPAGASGSLEAAVAAARDQHVPATLLPVGRMNLVGEPAGDAPNLWLVTSGKKAGQLGVLDPAAFVSMFPGRIDLSQPEVGNMLLESMLPVATSLSALFKKLKARPREKLPVWLQHIRNNDVPAFLAWLEAGGDLTATHRTYGFLLPLTVLDYITSQASPELVRELLARQHIKPKQIRESWQLYFRADINRFRALMPVLDKHVWPAVLQSHGVWEHVDLLEELAAAGIDFNAVVGGEGATPIHLAVQAGNKSALKW